MEPKRGQIPVGLGPCGGNMEIRRNDESMKAAVPELEQVEADLVPPERLPFIRGVDGLRAIAVMAVLFYHAEFGWALGGFLGVEMFLVISGYLITSLLLVEWLKTGRIDFKAFWFRRARRLLPAVGLLLAVVTTVSVLFYRDTVAQLFGEVVAAAGYVTNWLLIFKDVSYFESFERPSLLQHLWSLSVEEQFYVLWPILFAVGMGLLRFKTKKATLRAFLGITVVGIAGSTILMAALFTPFSDPSRVYYGTDTRMAGLLVGVALALVCIPWRVKPAATRVRRIGINVVGFGCLAVLAVILIRMEEFAPLLYRGGFLITSLATAGLIATVVHPSGRIGALLDNRVMNWIGTRSYGIYLWHWPIFMLTRPGFEVADAPVAVFVLRTAATFAFAEVSYRLVEMPIRKLGFKPWLDSLMDLVRRPSVRIGLIGAAVGVALAILMVGPQVSDTSASESALADSALTSEIVDTRVSSSPSASSSSISSATTTAPDPAVLPADVIDDPGTTEDTDTPSESVDPPDLSETQAPTSTTSPFDQPDSELWVDPASVPPPSVTIIGDSILAGSANAILATFPNYVTIDATVSRQFRHATDVADKLVSEDALGDIVIIHLGTNGAFSSETFDEVMESVSTATRVIVLTTAVPRRWEDAVNKAILAGAERWPNIEILDWQSIAKENDSWFNSDHVHLNSTGQQAYAEVLAETVNGG